MKRYERFAFRGRRYKFLNWESNRIAHAIDIKTDQEVWLVGVAETRLAREREHAEWIRQRREALSASGRAKRNWESDMVRHENRLKSESEQILMSNPALRVALLQSLMDSQKFENEEESK